MSALGLNNFCISRVFLKSFGLILRNGEGYRCGGGKYSECFDSQVITCLSLGTTQYRTMNRNQRYIHYQEPTIHTLGTHYYHQKNET